MSGSSKPPLEKSKEISSFLDKIVEWRFLLLFLCFSFYLDIWLLQYHINPTALSLSDVYAALLSAPVFNLFLFIGSYSLLMIGFFPFLRRLLGEIRCYFTQEYHNLYGSSESHRISDWSLAFVCLSTYDGIIGYFFTNNSYKGLALYIFNLIKGFGFAGLMFRLCVSGFLVVCFTLALRVHFRD